MKLGQNFVKYFVCFLGNGHGVSRKNAFEIYWPLAAHPMLPQISNSQYQIKNFSLVQKLIWLEILEDKQALNYRIWSCSNKLNKAWAHSIQYFVSWGLFGVGRQPFWSFWFILDFLCFTCVFLFLFLKFFYSNLTLLESRYKV